MLFLLAALSGALTIFSPYILPIAPFVLARAGTPFRLGALPLLCEMALTFAAVATLGSVAASWAVHLDSAGRTIAIIAVGLLGVSLIWPPLAQWFATPFVRLSERLAESPSGTSGEDPATTPGRRALVSFLLGMATGLLWAPCAGPVLGLVLAGAIWQGPNAHTTLLLLTYALGAATSLALVMSGGTALMKRVRPSARIASGVRRGVGICVLMGASAVAVGVDLAALAPWSSQGVDAVERHWLKVLPAASPNRGQIFGAEKKTDTQRETRSLSMTEDPYRATWPHTVRVAAPAAENGVAVLDLPSLGKAPPIQGAVQWLNTPPLSPVDLKGKVVLVNFWTFGCINCKNALPHVRDWYLKYKDQGLVVIGVHSPEFAFEKNISNVKKALLDLEVPFPVAVDNNFNIWRSFNNQYWPANYFIDSKGQIRFEHFGEGEYAKSEAVIQQLLSEAKKSQI